MSLSEPDYPTSVTVPRPRDRAGGTVDTETVVTVQNDWETSWRMVRNSKKQTGDTLSECRRQIHEEVDATDTLTKYLRKPFTKQR